MADTRRTLAALQTLLADNTSGDISAQDMRDVLVSVYGGWVPLESHVASASASLVFSTRNAEGASGNTFQSDFDDYILRVDALLPSTAGANLMVQISVNAGANWNVANCHFSIFHVDLTGTGANGSNNPSTVGMVIANNLDGVSGVNGQVDIWTPLNATLDKQMTMWSSYRSAANFFHNSGAGLYLSTAAIDQIRLIPSAGVLASGYATLYGVPRG